MTDSWQRLGNQITSSDEAFREDTLEFRVSQNEMTKGMSKGRTAAECKPSVSAGSACPVCFTSHIPKGPVSTTSTDESVKCQPKLV